MQALHDGAKGIMLGQGDVYMIGGVEHMGHVPMNYNIDLNTQLNKTTAMASGSMDCGVRDLYRRGSVLTAPAHLISIVK